jgi:hypothetical protein
LILTAHSLECDVPAMAVGDEEDFASSVRSANHAPKREACPPAGDMRDG